MQAAQRRGADSAEHGERTGWNELPVTWLQQTADGVQAHMRRPLQTASAEQGSAEQRHPMQAPGADSRIRREACCGLLTALTCGQQRVRGGRLSGQSLSLRSRLMVECERMSVARLTAGQHRRQWRQRQRGIDRGLRHWSPLDLWRLTRSLSR